MSQPQLLLYISNIQFVGRRDECASLFPLVTQFFLWKFCGERNFLEFRGEQEPSQKLVGYRKLGICNLPITYVNKDIRVYFRQYVQHDLFVIIAILDLKWQLGKLFIHLIFNRLKKLLNIHVTMELFKLQQYIHIYIYIENV